MSIRRATRERCRGRMKAMVVMTETEKILVEKLGIPLVEYAKQKRPQYLIPKFGGYK